MWGQLPLLGRIALCSELAGSLGGSGRGHFISRSCVGSIFGMSLGVPFGGGRGVMSSRVLHPGSLWEGMDFLCLLSSGHGFLGFLLALLRVVNHGLNGCPSITDLVFAECGLWASPLNECQRKCPLESSPPGLGGRHVPKEVEQKALSAQAANVSTGGLPGLIASIY